MVWWNFTLLSFFIPLPSSLSFLPPPSPPFLPPFLPSLPPLAALPLYSVTRAFCKDLLRDTFTTLLLPNASKEGSHDPRGKEPAPNTFKYILNLAKEANSSLLARHSHVKSLNTAAGSSDSGRAKCLLHNVMQGYTSNVLCYTISYCFILVLCSFVSV